MSSANSIQAGRAYIALSADSSKLGPGLKNASSLIQRFANNSAELFRNLIGLHYTMQNIVRPVIDVYAKFDDQMRLTKAVTGATGDQFQKLTDRAKQLGRDTAFTAAEVASGMTSLGRMGFSSSEIDTAISSVMNLSRATGTDLAQSADIAANSLRIFGMESTQMSHVADILTATANGSAQTLTDLFEALKMAGPQAAAAKESLTDVSAAIGVMANVGIKGSMAGTALRRAYINMANGKIQEYLKQYNIQTVDAAGNLRKMKDIIVEVGKAMQNMGTAEKMSFAEEVFDMRGSFVGLTLGGNVEGMQEFIDKLERAEDVAAKTATEMEAGMGGALRMMKSAFESVIIAIGETVNGFVSFGAGFAANVFRGITAFIRAMPEVATVITGVGTAVVPAVAGLFTLALGMKGVSLASGLCSTAIGGVQRALTMLSSHPIIAVLTVLAAAITYHIGRLRIMAAEIRNVRNEQAQLNKELAKQGGENQQAQAKAQTAGGQFGRLTELAELSRQQKLTNSELLEADALIQRLAPYGSSYFAQLDAVAGSLTLAADAQRQFNAAANASQLPGLEAERDKILQMVEAIKAERDAIIKRNGVKSVMRNQVVEEQAQVRIDEQMGKIAELQDRIDELKKPIPLDIQTPDKLPSMADLENADKTLAELDAKINDAGKTDSQRKEDELKRQNDLYREQIKLLQGVEAAKAEKIRGNISELTLQKENAYSGTSEQRAAEINDVASQLEVAKANVEDKKYDVSTWQQWKKDGNELFDAQLMERDVQALLFAEEKAKALAQRLAELNASKTTAEVDLQINQEYTAMGNVDKEMEALQNRLAEYEGKVNTQREKIQREEANKIMADIQNSDRTRQQEKEDKSWQQGVDSLFSSGNLADAIAQATNALNIEQGNESQIRNDLGYALENNDPESMRRLSEDLKRSQGRQEYITQAISKADEAQKGSESSVRELSRENLGSFITADIMNLLGNPQGPEEETARNTRATVANLATLIDVVRRNEGLAFS
ncbi:MAG: phage tail tape measure protein [Proteiniphilum sp.]